MTKPRLFPEAHTDVRFLEAMAAPVPLGVPKYVQLREALRSMIRGQHWKPGSRLPTETELVRLSRLSLGTVQRALRELAQEGVLVRTHGSGTFVGSGKGVIDEPVHLRFLGEPGEPQFLPLYPKALSVSRADKPGPWSEWLQQEPEMIVKVERTLSVNREFDLYDCFYFSAQVFPEIAQRPREAFDGANLKLLLSSTIGLQITDVRQHLSFVRLPRKAIAAIGLKPGAEGLLAESAAAAGRRNPIYYLTSYIPRNDRRLDFS